ncbi:MAG: superoxide dismutase family protein [Hyphomonadaceae bacterium]
MSHFPTRAAAFFTSALAALALSACAHVDASGGGSAAAAGVDPRYVGQTAAAQMLNRDGQAIGQVELVEGPQGLLVRLAFTAGALSPGWHGLHFHERGACDDHSAGFTASGAHVGHGEGRHGLLNPNGPEPGDLPAIWAPASGAFEAELYSPFLTLGAHVTQARAAVLDVDGAALIVHANRDDQTTQPIGGAGGRVACAVFTAG